MSIRPFSIVTGASRGIGRAAALALARAGHDLLLTCREDRTRLEETIRNAQAAGAACRGRVADVANEAEVADLFGELGEDSRRLAGLVNNAGYAGDRGKLTELPMEMIDRILAVNLRGAILMCRGAIPPMAARGAGAIVNLSSQSAVHGGTDLSVYAATKAALNGLTISLAREVAPQGIRVNAVSPGPVLTDPVQALPPERLKQMRASLPMGRFCREDEVADVVVWLLSAQASYVSGAIVPVHGAR